MQFPPGKILLLFDGFCLLCNRAVRFILRFDKKEKFLFSPLSSETGKYWKEKLSIPEDLDSIILIDGEQYFSKSMAAFRIAKHLGGLFKLALIFKVLPQKTLDNLYDWVAKNRYDWFGKNNTCMLPSNDEKNRVI